jgi:GTP-binding protein Era
MEEAANIDLFEEIVPLSALTGDNCDRLESLLVRRMPPGPPLFPPDTLTDLPQKLMVAEMIREQVLLKTHQEVPHATAVVVDTIRMDGDLMRIDATIFVERSSHKGILIGEHGRMMKLIGSGARLNIESSLGSRVHLSLWVKVKEGWRDDTSLLRQIGLPLP